MAIIVIIIVVVIILLGLGLWFMSSPKLPQAGQVSPTTPVKVTAANVIPTTPVTTTTGTGTGTTTVTKPAGTIPSTTPVVVPAATIKPSTYLWDPVKASTLDPTKALVAGKVGTDTMYVAAAKVGTSWVLGKSNGTLIWWGVGDKAYSAQLKTNGVLLPKALIPNASWGAPNVGVALVGKPTDLVCRVQMSNGIHPGYATGRKCMIANGTVNTPVVVYTVLNTTK